MKTSCFTEDNGKLSIVRIAFAAWTLLPLLIWAIISVIKLEILSFPETIIAVIGVMATNKLGQKYFESNPDSKPTS